MLSLKVFFFLYRSSVMWKFAFVILQPEGAATEMEVIIQRACNLLFDTNFGISFGLYCASGQNFRSAVAQLFSCHGRGRGGDTRSGMTKRSSTNHHGKDPIVFYFFIFYFLYFIFQTIFIFINKSTLPLDCTYCCRWENV